MLSAAHPADDVRIVVKEGAALAAAGWRVIHLSHGAAAGTLHGVELRGHGGPGRGWRARLRHIPALARAAAAQHPAVIHAHEPDSWIAAHLAAARCGARVVLDVHEHYPSRLDARLGAGPARALRPVARALIAALCRLIAWRADAVVVAKDGLDGPFGRCVAVRNYAEPASVAPRRHAAGSLRLLHLGALGAARGAFTMLDLLARLPDATLVLVGRFTDGSEAAFDARAAALGVVSRIEKHGWLPRTAALDQAARCDIALVLFQPGVENHRLALPHKLFDAMLCGLPVIVPAFAEEVSRIVAEAGCGLAIDTADAEAVARAATILCDPPLRAGMGASGREAALTRFAWQGEAVRLVALYRRLLPAARFEGRLVSWVPDHGA
jgi:glycosyltransferase involved in cell wall biosynthesis